MTNKASLAAQKKRVQELEEQNGQLWEQFTLLIHGRSCSQQHTESVMQTLDISKNEEPKPKNGERKS